MRLENKINDEHALLKYGNEYHLWKEGRYLGVAIWTKDDILGDCFQTSFIDETGRLLREIFEADKWVINIRRGIVGAVYEFF